MDYDSFITPGALCTNCKNHGQITQTSIGPLVRCTVYYSFTNHNDQAEHCINYCPVDEKSRKVHE